MIQEDNFISGGIDRIYHTTYNIYSMRSVRIDNKITHSYAFTVGENEIILPNILPNGTPVKVRYIPDTPEDI